ncbi:MAG: PDZ domain-containing protein [Alistipes sp.]|nr:PDZ domain-containing protein [Alistipes sp.]
MIKRVLYILVLLAVACTQPGYPDIDNPQQGGSAEDRKIIDYIDQRLSQEYYWLDEVEEKQSRFNRNLKWENYLDASLAMLSTNSDDGYINSKGQRVFYSYIRKSNSTTRATVAGFGIGLHYTIAVIDSENQHYGFVVERVYPDSPAERAGVLRGDVITMIGNSYINPSNYATRFNSIEHNTASSLELKLRRQSDNTTHDVELTKASYSETPVIYSDVIEVDNQKIGYLAYTSFVGEYDEELLNAIREIKAQGATDLVLDLRCNSGGSVLSAVKLCSALLPIDYEGRVLCHLERNKRNTVVQKQADYLVENSGEILRLERLYVICSDYTASASELVVMGLRGLDFPVMLIGSQTEGKNCGMDVTTRTISNTTVEFAPITFMCFNAKGYGDWGEGIVPDIDLTSEDNEYGVCDKNYPLPRTTWGDYQHDIALATALAKLTGKSLTQPATRSSVAIEASDISLPREVEGMRVY